MMLNYCDISLYSLSIHNCQNIKFRAFYNFYQTNMNYLKLANKYSTAKYTNFKSAKVRQQFIDYFVNQHHHEFIKSSPVVPYCDPTVAFVNAGMNQVNLGTY